jgi:hypothetical protein
LSSILHLIQSFVKEVELYAEQSDRLTRAKNIQDLSEILFRTHLQANARCWVKNFMQVCDSARPTLVRQNNLCMMVQRL